MNILNTVLGALGGGGNDQNPLLSMAMSMLAGNSDGNSGLGQVLQQFQENGLGDAVQSWVGSGENMPISADQIMQAFGSDKLGEMAQQAGVAPEEASGQLADLLPQMIDKLTPDGQVPSGDLDMSSVASVLGNLFNK